jgi:hypothetical protein
VAVSILDGPAALHRSLLQLAAAGRRLRLRLRLAAPGLLRQRPLQLVAAERKALPGRA